MRDDLQFPQFIVDALLSLLTNESVFMCESMKKEDFSSQSLNPVNEPLITKGPFFVNPQNKREA